jgi:hypothetical protein
MLSDKAKQAIIDNIATKGKRKGAFKTTPPRSNTLAYAAWQGAMLSFNPYKASIAGIMFMTDEQREVMREVETWADANKHLRFLDHDRAVLESIGAW